MARLFMHRNAALAVLVGLALAASSSTDQSASAHEARSTLCKSSEKVLFACRAGVKVVSVCFGKGAYAYRYGVPGKLDIEILSNGADGKAYQSNVIGGEGGTGRNIRFVQSGYSYIVSSGEAGNLSDVPGKQWSILTVYKDHTELTHHDCKNVNPQPAMDSDLPDDPDASFVAWF